MAVTLRPYQSQAVERCFAFWLRSVKNLLLIAAVGAGKTVIASEIMKRHMIQMANRILFLAHREELLEQTVEKLHNVDSTIVAGIEQGKNVCPANAQVMVASIATVKNLDRIRRWTPLSDISLIIIDECHHATSSSYVDVLHAITKDNPHRHLLGITATPIRMDGENLSLVFDQLAFRIDMPELIDAGFLCPVRGYTIQTSTSLANVKVKASGDFDDEELAAAIDTSSRNQAIVKSYLQLGEKRPTVAFVANVDHAIHLATEFRKNGINAMAVHGKQKKDERKGIIEDFQRGSVQVLTNCNVLCLDEETEILTETGWVGSDEMSYAHRVANWSEDGSVFFAPPRFIVRRQRFPGERMVVLESKSQSIRVTEDHRMICSHNRGKTWKIVHAGKLVGEQAVLPVSGKAAPSCVNAQAIRPEALSLEDCELIGFWLGGGRRDNLPSGGQAYLLVPAASCQNISERIDLLVKKSGFPCVKKQHAQQQKDGKTQAPYWEWSLPQGPDFGPQQRDGVARLEPYLQKTGTPLLFGLNEPQFAALVSGLWLATGGHSDTSTPPNNIRICGTNKPLFDILQAVAAARGYHASIRPLRQRKKPSPRFSLSLTSRAFHRLTKDRMRFENGWKKERVWCVTSDTGNIIIRRQGSVCVTGNTEGFDAPHTGCVIIGRPTKSPIVYPQCVGRGLRLHSSKKDCIIIDIVDMQNQGVILLPKLFNLPENLKLKGENVRQVERVVALAKTYHHNLDWEVKRQFTTQDIRQLLQPPDFYHLAETIQPDESTEIAWIPLNKQFVIVIDAQKKKEARVYQDDLGNWRLRFNQQEFSLGAKKQEALDAATSCMMALLSKEELGMVRHPTPDGQPPSAEHVQALEPFHLPTSVIEKLSRSRAISLLHRLNFLKYVFRTKGMFQSGRYLGQFYEMVAFYDPDYIDAVAKLNRFIGDKAQPLNTLRWLKEHKPELFMGNLLPPYEELLDMCLHRANAYHARVRRALDGSPEFLQMKAQHTKHRETRFEAAGPAPAAAPDNQAGEHNSRASTSKIDTSQTGVRSVTLA